MSRKAKAKTPQSVARTAAPAPPVWKRRLFRSVAAVVLPVFIFFGAEVTLRLVGYGHSTGFFIPSKRSPPGLFTENPKFGWRFFPRRLARAPDPLLLTKEKPKGCYRI